MVCASACQGADSSEPRGPRLGTEGVAPETAASCVAMLIYQGRNYSGSGTEFAPVEGKPLGEATIPPCRDTLDGPEPEAEQVEVAEIEGVPPDVAITMRGRSHVFIRDGTDFDRLPPALAQLLHAPECEVADEPIVLSGPWDGIRAADGNTELDMEPPYDLFMEVGQSSSPRYERAYLTVRVPVELGRPLDRSDITSSLWKGDTISVTVVCRGGLFVAERVEAHRNAE
jgi:hypothetical protein